MRTHIHHHGRAGLCYHLIVIIVLAAGQLNQFTYTGALFLLAVSELVAELKGPRFGVRAPLNTSAANLRFVCPFVLIVYDHHGQLYRGNTQSRCPTLASRFHSFRGLFCIQRQSSLKIVCINLPLIDFPIVYL